MVFFAFHNPSVSLREPPPFTQGRLFYSPFFVTIPHKLKFENKVKVFSIPHKKENSLAFGVILLTENLRAQNVGRELVFSADMCYNDMGDASG